MAAPIQLFPNGQPPAPEPVNPEATVEAPTNPLGVVRTLLQERTDPDGTLLLRKWNGDFYRYTGTHWVDTDPESIRKWCYDRLEHAVYEVPGGKEEGPVLKPWNPDRSKVDKLVDAMVSPCLLPREIQAPSWLSTGESGAGYVPCLNGLVDVTTQAVKPATPDYFGTVCIPLEFDPDAAAPVEWITFLRGLWEPVDLTEDTPEEEKQLPVWHQRDDGTWWRDADEIRTLRQWMGYVLSGRLDLQKMLLVKGPPRSGKGTISRVMTSLIGSANCSGPTLAGIASNFGLETSIGKTLMIVGDARLASQGQETVIERLLSISGQDVLTIDRKNKQAWTGTMQARVMILSNDTPKFLDASGAIASRFIILEMTKSFLGEEDTELGDRLHAELPQILKWALDGLADLGRGRIHEPESHVRAMREMYNLVSPIRAFVADVCIQDIRACVPFSEMYEKYGVWCEENGRGKVNAARFSADLKSAHPHLKTDYRPRDDTGKKLPRHVKGLKYNEEWTAKPHWKTVSTHHHQS